MNKKILKELQYQTKLLETIVELLDSRQHEAQNKQQEVMGNIQEMIMSNPLIASNPKASKIISDLFPNLGEKK